MMKDKLEQFISENREEFDVFEPNPKMWEAINKEIAAPVERKIVPWKKILWRAASVVVIFAISFTISDYMHSDDQMAGLTIDNQILQEEFPEIIEAEAYYTMLVNSKKTELLRYASTYPDIEKQADYDLAELDSIYLELKKDLKDNIHNTEIIEAMIQNYRLKLQVLEEILSSISDNKKNNKKVDSYEI